MNHWLLIVYAFTVFLFSGNPAVHRSVDPVEFNAVKTSADFQKAGLASGDIIFQGSQSQQSKAIELATHSPYSHCGIIFFEKGKWMVWEAGQVVTKTDFDVFIHRGKDTLYYEVKRLKNRDEVFHNEKVLKKMSDIFYGEYYNKPYDSYFGWSDEKIYCSELVWKLYKQATGIEIGKPEKMKDFDLSNPVVQEQLRQRYGKKIPLEETVISPARIFNSELLETVISR